MNLFKKLLDFATSFLSIPGWLYAIFCTSALRLRLSVKSVTLTYIDYMCTHMLWLHHAPVVFFHMSKTFEPLTLNLIITYPFKLMGWSIPSEAINRVTAPPGEEIRRSGSGTQSTRSLGNCWSKWPWKYPMFSHFSRWKVMKISDFKRNSTRERLEVFEAGVLFFQLDHKSH